MSSERLREENIAKNRALLAELNLENVTADLGVPKPAPKAKPVQPRKPKRKAEDEAPSPTAAKRIKHDPDAPDAKPVLKRIPFPEKPAVIEERTGEIEFRVVNNDNERESLIVLTGLKCIFQKQLPKMPKDYIARLVYDRTHLSIAIVKKPLQVVG